jgi:tetratricopeptide (TPR) repeat protein
MTKSLPIPFGLKPLASAVTIIALTACVGSKPQTLGSLKYQPEPEPPAQTVTAVTHKEVRTEYQELLSIIDDKNLREQIERRIAHVYMLENDKDQVDGFPADTSPVEQKSYYVDAIKSYREILDKYPNSPDNAEILYQLAKAYDMEGNQDEALDMLLQLTTRHPYYENIAEAYFRKGDILFNRGQYVESEAAYRAVTTHVEAKFSLNAHYMLGWSHYKQLHFRQALNSFVYVTNQLLGPVASLDNLSKPDQSLVGDTLHAVSLSLDKLAGAATIETIPELREQHYVWMLYDNLGQYYLEKELFESSADSYRLFVQHHGDDDLTPIMHQKMIDTYVKGSFPRQAFDEKENYVDSYGIYSTYSSKRNGIPTQILGTMEAYLDELARNYHARGQEVQKEMEDLQADDKKPGLSPKKKEEQLQELDKTALAALDKAAYYYLQFVDTFPKHEKLDEYIFLRGEALFAANRFDESIPDYERVAYRGQTPIADQYGADAGYAAIVAYENHIGKLKREREINQWRSQAVASMLRFAEKYHQDGRSPSVLTNAAEYIFSLEDFPRALQIATDLINNNPDLDNTLKKTAYGIQAHSLFKLDRFDEAGASYLLQRQLVSAGSEEHTQITERLASAIYRHSETIIASDEKQAAVEELLRLKELTPDSPVRITAQYDAASLLIELQNWSRAIDELQELRTLFPDHELAPEFPRKLAYAFEKNQNWSQAAKEYLQLSESDADQDFRRESLFLAATMFENNTDYPEAITHLKSYNQLYPAPFSTMMEARYKLAQNYQKLNDTEKRLYWLQQLVDGESAAGKQSTDRSRWLAAWGNAEYGDYYAEQFEQITLTLPLDKSLPAKNEQLELATTRYQEAAESGIFEFVTLSAYKIAELYQHFATALRQSSRPAGLGAEEQALYSEILEEQALPFDELAMELHQSNIQRGWEGEYNQWIAQSFTMMSRLNPTRYAKAEVIVSYGDEIR